MIEEMLYLLSKGDFENSIPHCFSGQMTDEN